LRTADPAARAPFDAEDPIVVVFVLRRRIIVGVEVLVDVRETGAVS
jgi:hypothetical protein